MTGDLRLPTMRPCNVGQLPWLHADIRPRAKRIFIVLFRACASRLGLIPGWSPQLDAFRNKRNISDYERSGLISEK